MPGLLIASIVLTTASTIGTTTILHRSDVLDSFWLVYSILVSLGMGFTPLLGYWLLATHGFDTMPAAGILELLLVGVLYPPFYDLEPTMHVGAIPRIVNGLCLPIMVLAGLMVYNTLPYFAFWVVNALFTTITNVRSLS